ncbi:unnamed protein product [Polarella glacialis]|uniref:Uncharacterized protein n=1 Tax=Polarella glacialis TaxID=89957 RepID=A0A813G865_POLGL|nr:unnamed protein product [Polarella glacialis]
MSDYGYYSPNETMHVPHHRGGPMMSILRAAIQDAKSCIVEVKRNWTASTDPDFLISAASRRDLWRLLLPIPTVLAMLVDHNSGNLLILDASFTAALFCAGNLPIAWLASDLVICLLFASYMPTHAVMSMPAELSYAAGPVAAIFAMASCGVNATILMCFAFLSYVTAPYIAVAWPEEQVICCAYVLFVACVTELRSASCAVDVRRHSQGGYKALTYLGDAVSTGPSRMIDAMSSRYTADSLPRCGGSDTEDPWRPPPRESSGMALVDQLLARLGNPEGRGGQGFVTSIFSRVANPVQSVASRHKESRQRFAAEQVRPPGAAVHEAPLFSDKTLSGVAAAADRPDPEASTGVNQYRPGSPSSSSSSLAFPKFGAPGSPMSSSTAGAFLKGVKLSGFKNETLNSLFVEKKGSTLLVGGRETYWLASNEYFIYKSSSSQLFHKGDSTTTWAVGKGKRFSQIQVGKSNGVAHSPEGFEIWAEGNEPAGSKKAWREWDAVANSWMTRPNSGVQSRGKVRPQVAPLSPKAGSSQAHLSPKGQGHHNASVQTDKTEVHDESAQTDMVLGSKTVTMNVKKMTDLGPGPAPTTASTPSGMAFRKAPPSLLSFEEGSGQARGSAMRASSAGSAGRQS